MRLTALLAALALAGTARAEFVPLAPLTQERTLKFTEPQWVINPAHKYRAVVKTTRGDVTLDLYAGQAPKTVNSFVFLALNRYYDGTPFHRVVPGFVAQGGDPTGTGTGGPGYDFYIEIDRKLRFDQAGVLGMARTGDPHGNGSQFFITLAPADFLSGQYTVFGRVTQGMDIVNALRKTEGPDAGQPDRIVSVTILEERP